MYKMTANDPYPVYKLNVQYICPRSVLCHKSGSPHISSMSMLHRLDSGPFIASTCKLMEWPDNDHYY